MALECISAGIPPGYQLQQAPKDAWVLNSSWEVIYSRVNFEVYLESFPGN